MFSGIVETIGEVVKIKQIGISGQAIVIKSLKPLANLKQGDSIAVNGVCLTVVELQGSNFKVEAVGETLRLTNIALLQQGDLVNLEMALLPTTRIGGHFVQGHIDGTAEVIAITHNEIARFFKFKLKTIELATYIVTKGFIAIDGVSLTVVDIRADEFRIMIIPHTYAVTRIQNLKLKDVVNIEVDILAKYIVKQYGREYE